MYEGHIYSYPALLVCSLQPNILVKHLRTELNLFLMAFLSLVLAGSVSLVIPQSWLGDFSLQIPMPLSIQNKVLQSNIII